MARRRKKYIHEGNFVAEVEVDLIGSNTGWSPYLSLEDAYKLDEIREALLEDLSRASRLARIYVLKPVEN